MFHFKHEIQKVIDFQRLIELLTYSEKAPMIFNTGLFLWLFCAVMFIFYFLRKHDTPKIIFLTLFSFYFYYKSSGIYFLLLVISTFVDYSLGEWIYRAQSKAHKQLVIVISLIVNLGVLGYFKYTNFFYETYIALTGGNFHKLDIFLPVGISFYTFQSLSYTIDIYRGEIKPIKRMLDYAFFVSFFPQLVAGPIVRAKDFIPQIYRPNVVTKEMFGRAVFLIVTGLFKKTVISDYLSINFVDRIFDEPTLYTGLENLFGVYGYALQIYCDFSGYSDMAIGIALLMGYEFCLNFDSPYQSSSITEFWRRWHKSLSTWLRDYLYISLGGNRHGRARTYLNLFITMLLGGLWHGAAMRFILWGALHGVGLAIDKFVKEFIFTTKSKNPIPLWQQYSKHILGVLFTFHFVCFCWIFFRAESMKVATDVLTQIIFHFNGQIFPKFVEGYTGILTLMLIGYILHFIPQNFTQKVEDSVTSLGLAAKIVLIVAMIVLVVQFKSSEIQPFIYFQF